MARFIAKYAKYRHGVRTGRFMVLEDGQRQELSKELFAKFEVADAKPEEREFGAQVFKFAGLPEDRDTNEHVRPHYRVAGFDSEKAKEMYGWTDEEHDIVVNVLRNSPANGDEFIEVTPVKAPLPWPTYDSLTSAKKIVELASSIGVSLDDVLAYERQNANRDEVIDAIDAALNLQEESEGPEVVIKA